MIIYQETKARFLHHAFEDDIQDVILRHYKASVGAGAAKPMITSWANSLMEMAKVLKDDEIPDDAGIAIEYQLPQSSKRIDFIITGEGEDARPRVVIVELKQWSESRRSARDAIVWARRGGRAGETEGTHPSYQAWTYAAYLEDFNTEVQRGVEPARTKMRQRHEAATPRHNHRVLGAWRQVWIVTKRRRSVSRISRPSSSRPLW